MPNKVDVYRQIIREGLDYFQIDSEEAHDAVVSLLQVAQSSPGLLEAISQVLTHKRKVVVSKRLRTELPGLDLVNPLMLGAGFLKQGQGLETILRTGFSAATTGTVPEKAQDGNEKPRVARTGKKHDSILNNYGFPSVGMERVKENIQSYDGQYSGAVGISVGMNKDVPHARAPEVHAAVFRYLYEIGDYFEINVTSPNTPNLRNLLTYEHLSAIVQACQETISDDQKQKPIYLKLSPDMSFAQLEEIIRVVKEKNLAGVILTNTSNDPKLKSKIGSHWEKQEGGVSGKILEEKSNIIIRHAHQNYPNMTIIGAGGIRDLASALRKFESGASALQILSALVTEGMAFPSVLLWNLDKWMEKKGVDSIQELVGQSLK